jgi:hypothetical protein
VFHGILDQFGTGFNVELFHHPVLVMFNGPCRDIQNGCDFFTGLPFSKELENLPLPGADFLE